VAVGIRLLRFDHGGCFHYAPPTRDTIAKPQ
jgi:hypothetical protein